jgi:ABC-type phosphate transport system substrate-binding protein
MMRKWLKIYGDNWDIATDIEKESLRETQISKAWRSKIKAASDQATKIEKWSESVDTYIDDPITLNDNPELEGKTEEFRNYANEAENNSVPFKVLVGSFLHLQSQAKTHNKGKMFERAKGGSNEKPKLKNGKITLEEARVLRETNYDLYKQKLNANLIEMNV